MEEGVDNGDWLGDAVKGRTWGMRLKVSEVVVDGWLRDRHGVQWPSQYSRRNHNKLRHCIHAEIAFAKQIERNNLMANETTREQKKNWK